MSDMPTAICNHCQNLFLLLAEITTEDGMERPKLQLFLQESNPLLLGEKDFPQSLLFFCLIALLRKTQLNPWCY